MFKPTVHVAIGLLFHQGKVLVGWRNADQHQGNKYEFPGGKVEQGETPEQACRREIFEEVGIGIQKWHIFDVIHHVYDDVEVYLHLFHAHVPIKYLSDIQKPWTWYYREKLLELNFPKANQIIIERLHWKHTIQISADLTQLNQLADDRLLYWRTESTLISMQDFQHFTDPQLKSLILNVELWMQLDEALQKKIGAVQFKQHQILALHNKQLPIGIRCIASCHDAVSLQWAHKIGCDAVFLSPVQVTESHPETPALGWEQFHELAKSCDIPVFALGGLKPQDLLLAQRYLAYGVAGIRGFESH
ncbi:NUDIX domain-containing protein [Acinetobacter sp. ANC 4648]|uniref:NUDIX domain-containing protein n=1 Tax=Acinetobacter sp. ANC 4648 TaxID=1977875 RepID=UPI000A332BF8|nr:NUDIX domain-containing protein [Acinetobacter sp. ANC 4648]OTG81655.1 dGTP triphosphohydrolase [Acinetobacter sp. ANC 4648]